MKLPLKGVLSKTQVEFSFRPKLASWENTLFTAQLFESEFPDWQIEQGRRSEIILLSKEKKEFLKIGFNSFLYVTEAGVDYSKFVKFLKIASEKFEENGVEVFNFTSFKTFSIYESGLKFQELSDIIFEKLFSSESYVKNISGSVALDLGFALDGENNGFKNKCKIGPMDKDQVLHTLKTAFDYSGEDLKEDSSYLSVDVGVFSEKLDIVTLKDLVEVYEYQSTENLRIRKGYVDVLSNISS